MEPRENDTDREIVASATRHAPLPHLHYATGRTAGSSIFEQVIPCTEGKASIYQILQDWRPAERAGVILWLLDSGSTCFASPHKEHILCAVECDMSLRGVGTTRTTMKSPLVLTMLDSKARYCTFAFPKCYNLDGGSLDFAIASAGALEGCGWSFVLDHEKPYMRSPAGCEIPLLTDFSTGFHFIPEQLRAEPSVRYREKHLQIARRQAASGAVFKYAGTPTIYKGPTEAKPMRCLTNESYDAYLKVQTRGSSSWNKSKVPLKADQIAKEWIDGKRVDEILNLEDSELEACEKEAPASKAEDTSEIKVETSDEAYMKKVKMEAEKAGFKKPIRLKLPHIRLADTGEEEDIQKLRQYVHNLFGHLELKKVFEAIDHIKGAEILKILKILRGHNSDSHCETCAEYKSRLPSLPKGRTERPPSIRRTKKVYVDLMGYIAEPSAFHNYHYIEGAITDRFYAEIVGLAFRSQALLGMARIFSKLGGFPEVIQIDGESTLATSSARDWMTGKGSARNSTVVVCEPYNQFRNGRIERMWQTWKSIARCLLGKAKLPVKYWYHAVKFAVTITNMVTLVKDEHGEVMMIEGSDGIPRPMTAYEAHFGVKPDLQRTLLGPFGALAYLILTREQRSARSLSGSFGVRAIAGIYLGPQICPRTGVYNHVITDGRSLFTSPQNIKVIPDVFPGAYAGEAGAEGEAFTESDMLTALQERDTSTADQGENDQIRHLADELRSRLAARGDTRAEDTCLTALADEDAGSKSQPREGLSDAGVYHKAWVAACREQSRTEQEEIAFVRSSQDGESIYAARKAKSKATKTRPNAVVAAKGDKHDLHDKILEAGTDPNVEVGFETPEDLKVPALPEEYEYLEPYPDAKYQILVPRDFKDEGHVKKKLDHPHLRFIGRTVRKAFSVPNRNGKTTMRDFTGKVESYSEPRLLFKIVYEDGDREECDFQQLMDIVVMGEKYGDDKNDAGKTRVEVLERMKGAVLAHATREEMWATIEERAYSDSVEAWYEALEAEWVLVTGEHSYGCAGEGLAAADGKATSDSRNTSTLGTLEVPVADLKTPVVYDDEPNTQRELEAHPEREAILTSGRAEMDQLIAMDVGTLVSREEVDKLIRSGQNILRSRMIYKRKYGMVDGKERFLKWKGRLAVNGRGQEKGVDTVWDSFSPTVGFSAIRSMISVLCDPKYAVESYDLSGAFLGTRLEDQAVYVRLPYDAGDYAHRVIRLTKAVYGVKNSGKLFMRQLGEEILKFEEHVVTEIKGRDGNLEKQVDIARFERMRSDQCMYVYKDKLGRHMIFLSYVDDIILATTDKELRDRFLAQLRKTWKITCEGTLDRFLAVNFSRSADGWCWTACLSSYIEKIAVRFGLTETRVYKTPMEPGFVLTEDDFKEEPTEEMKSLMRSLIGSIGFATTALRYDAAYAVSVLSRHLVRPCQKVIDAAKRVIMYLYATRDFRIQWRSSREEHDNGTANTLMGAVDASFANDTMTRRSHGGYVNFINSGAVSWKSGLQAIVTLSSCEAEYVALCAEVCEVMYLRNLLHEMSFAQRDSTLIWEDNKAAILVAEQETSSAGRCKHIDVKYRFVAEAVKDGVVRVRYTPTDTNVADLFTKPLTIAVFERLLKASLDQKSVAWLRGDESVTVAVDSELFMLVDV